MTLDSAKSKFSDLDEKLHDDFVRMDEEAAKDPYDEPQPKAKKKHELDTALIQETNQDGLMRGHNAI